VLPVSLWEADLISNWVGQAVQVFVANRKSSSTSSPFSHHQGEEDDRYEPSSPRGWVGGGGGRLGLVTEVRYYGARLP
jgi:hypothetical protein